MNISRPARAGILIVLVLLLAGVITIASSRGEGESAAPQRVSSTAPASTTTTVDPAIKRAADRERWINTTNWVNRINWINTTTWVEKTEARIAAEKARQERLEAERAAAAAKAAQQTPSPSKSAPAPAPAPSGGSVSHGGVCNGIDLPPCYVVQRESGFNPTAENPTSTASGLYQFVDGTWAGFGGYSHASYAPVSVQVAKARLVWANGAGCGHWNAC